MVIEIATQLGSPTSLSQNRHNAILHIGHQNGTITLWSPNSTTPHVKLLAHRGPVRSIAVDREGRYMVSTGQDLKMSVWDIRMFKEVNSYFTRQPGSSVSISDQGLTAVGWGTQTSVWRGLFSKASRDQEKIQSPTWPGAVKASTSSVSDGVPSRTFSAYPMTRASHQSWSPAPASPTSTR